MEYDINEAAYGTFPNFISMCMELPFCFNAYMTRNVVNWAWVNLAIPLFERFEVQGESGGVCMVEDLNNINAQDFNILLDDMSVGAQVSCDDFDERLR